MTTSRSRKYLQQQKEWDRLERRFTTLFERHADIEEFLDAEIDACGDKVCVSNKWNPNLSYDLGKDTLTYRMPVFGEVEKVVAQPAYMGEGNRVMYDLSKPLWPDMTLPKAYEKGVIYFYDPWLSPERKLVEARWKMYYNMCFFAGEVLNQYGFFKDTHPVTFETLDLE